MWPMILLMSHLPREGRRPEKLGYQQSRRQSADRHYQAIVADIMQRSAIG